MYFFSAREKSLCFKLKVVYLFSLFLTTPILDKTGCDMAIEIREVQNKKALKQFVRFPYDLYKKNPYWVPPLRSDEMNTLSADKNPAFEHCESRYWMAFDGKRMVGRIAGILNHKAIEKWGKRQIRFGWFDFIDDNLALHLVCIYV